MRKGKELALLAIAATFALSTLLSQLQLKVIRAAKFDKITIRMDGGGIVVYKGVTNTFPAHGGTFEVTP